MDMIITDNPIRNRMDELLREMTSITRELTTARYDVVDVTVELYRDEVIPRSAAIEIIVAAGYQTVVERILANV